MLLYLIFLACIVATKKDLGIIDCKDRDALGSLLPLLNETMELEVYYSTGPVNKPRVTLNVGAVIYGIGAFSANDTEYCESQGLNDYNVTLRIGKNQVPNQVNYTGMLKVHYYDGEFNDFTYIAAHLFSDPQRFLIQLYADETAEIDWYELLEIDFPGKEDGDMPKCYYKYALYSCWVSDFWLKFGIGMGVGSLVLSILLLLICCSICWGIYCCCRYCECCQKDEY